MACCGGVVLSVRDFLGAVSRCCARIRSSSVTHWFLERTRDDTLVLSIQDASLAIIQPHAAYMAVGKLATGVADQAMMSECRCFASFSRATLMSARDARHTVNNVY